MEDKFKYLVIGVAAIVIIFAAYAFMEMAEEPKPAVNTFKCLPDSIWRAKDFCDRLEEIGAGEENGTEWRARK